MVDMINFLRYHGAKIYKGIRIYLNSVPVEKFPIMISKSEYSKAYFDIKDNRFYNLSYGYKQALEQRASEEKELVEEWIRQQEESKTKEEVTTPSEPIQIPKIKAESAKEESKQANKELNKLKARIEKNRDKEKAKGFYSLCLLICEKFNFKEKEAVNKTIEVIEHGMVYFTLRNEELKKIIIKDLESQKYLTENLIPLIKKQLKKVNTFDDLFNYVHTGDFLEMKKNVSSFICKSESKATVDNKPQRSESQKQADKKYNKSEKGKQASKKYRDSEKGRETIMKYRESEAGKEAKAKANKKYRDSEKGQEQQKQAYNKYKDSEKGKQARREAVRKYRERQKALKASQGGIINGFHQKES